MFHWVSLPTEIRLMILELLAQKDRLASYAPVCKEWQASIEKKNFRRLKLRFSCLDNFEHMIGRQRWLVKHTWLNIELRKYTCRSCQDIESYSWASGNHSIISRATLKLFSVLSTWNPAGNGLTLEISIHSPSDQEHWFQNCYFGADNEDEDITNPKTSRQPLPSYMTQNMAGLTVSRLRLQVSVLWRDYEEVYLRFMENLPENRFCTTSTMPSLVYSRHSVASIRQTSSAGVHSM